TALDGTDSPNYFERPTFDYTAGGMFDPFNNYDQFLAMSQAFEDTGVRAYKGQAHNLMSQPDILKTALQIHSAEARQAAEVRQLRGEKGWITANQRGTNMPEATQPTYNGEENTMQSGFNAANIPAQQPGPAIPNTAGTQAFDEPLAREQVVSITEMFLP
ncbi:MAG: ferritin-like domain-containing protein, partial [Sphingobacteriales bacterium]